MVQNVIIYFKIIPNRAQTILYFRPPRISYIFDNLAEYLLEKMAQ